jgi:hypothetical protein
MQARVTREFLPRCINFIDAALLWVFLVFFKVTRLFKHGFRLAVTRKLSSEVHGVKVHLPQQDYVHPQKRQKTLFLPLDDDWKLARESVLSFCSGNGKVFRC